jgi:hypothetical protein
MAADDQNVICAATLVGPIFQVRCTIVNEKKKLGTWISHHKKLKMAPFSRILSNIQAKRVPPQTLFLIAIVSSPDPICGPLFRIEKVAAIEWRLLSQQAQPLGRFSRLRRQSAWAPMFSDPLLLF